ncbi:hypothetical protein CK3_34050 [butyrate-producing bacterium SS3/4]|nr:hypothetical protein CK3_34050 [butyrate-producing bacterium SS3/4]
MIVAMDFLLQTRVFR